jgi:SAM-dependent methyltransferase
VILDNTNSGSEIFSNTKMTRYSLQTMKIRLLNFLACPKCYGTLQLKTVDDDSGDRIITGSMGCIACSAEFPIVNGIPRFVPLENFAASFGFQWNRFGDTQLDETLGFDLSAKRFFEETGWPRSLAGQLCLEAGSGMGRFTRCAAQTGAEIITFDYSSAIEANFRNNSKYENVHFLQADIFHMPFKKAIFDKIFCFGVIQHTPSPKDAFLSLLPFGKSGAEIAFDVYRRSWKSIFWGQYYLRALTKRIPPETLFPLVEKYFSMVYRLTGWVRPMNDHYSKILSLALGTADYRGMYPMAPEKMKELCLLDTFDKLSPAFDKPQTLRAVNDWLKDARLKLGKAVPGYNGIEARCQLT